MKWILGWIWNRGIVSTFLSGLFTILPVVLTVMIVSWLVSYLHALLGPDTTVGHSLRNLGLQFVTDDLAATLIGWGLVLSCIWLLGLVVKWSAVAKVKEGVNAIVARIPFVKGIFGTATQLVGMMRRDDQSELTAMRVVFCSFGEQHGGGFLALLASPDTYRFREQDCRVVYIPTSPLPMSGGIVFVPSDKVTPVDMPAEQLMQIYFSLGILTSQVVPKEYQVAA